VYFQKLFNSKRRAAPHAPEFARRASRQLLVRDGKITRDEGKGVVMDVV